MGVEAPLPKVEPMKRFPYIEEFTLHLPGGVVHLSWALAFL
jgi:hypothetical protein